MRGASIVRTGEMSCKRIRKERDDIISALKMEQGTTATNINVP